MIDKVHYEDLYNINMIPAKKSLISVFIKEK